MTPRIQVVEHNSYFKTDIDPLKKDMFITLERVVAPKGEDVRAGDARHLASDVPIPEADNFVQDENSPEDLKELDQGLEWKHTDVDQGPNGQFQEVIEEGEIFDNAQLLHRGEIFQLNEIHDGEESDPEVFLHAGDGQFCPLGSAQDLETVFVEAKDSLVSESSAAICDKDPLEMLASQFAIKVVAEGQPDPHHAGNADVPTSESSPEPEWDSNSERERKIQSMITSEDVDWADLMKSHKVVSSDAD